MAVQLTQKEEVIWIQGQGFHETGIGKHYRRDKRKNGVLQWVHIVPGYPCMVPDMAVDRLHEAGPEMERMHQLQMATLEKAEMRATDKLSLQSIEEGVKKECYR